MPSTAGQRGRPPVWCSPECRRLASEERRAARAGGRAVEVHEQVREKVIVRTRSISPDSAVDKVLSDSAATEKLLRVLAHRRRHDPPQTTNEKWTDQRMRPFLYELWQAYHDAAPEAPVAMPETVESTAATAAAHRAAVALVLSSPRSIREVLTTLAGWARAGTLARGEHSATVRAAGEFLDAMLASRLLRARR
ncbi:hypothetical protein [Nocardia sp. NPDC059239]|uniref:hypothetical protein n=1 Tax=unclassified Nocardia TaxID=2637762 RepID=UPI0036C26ABF